MADILIIDDEKAIRKTLSEILSFEGYKIDEASDGEEGLKKFRERNYDVVLCDIKMPKMNGFELYERLFMHYHNRHCALICKFLCMTRTKKLVHH